MSSEYILTDIVEEILKRLPLKPILKFRCVSKPWKRLIDSPRFIAFYGVRCPQPHRFIGRKEFSDVPNESKSLTFVDNDDRFRKEPFSFVRPDLLESDESDDPCVVGSSHGLLCFKKIVYEYLSNSGDHVITEMVVLWNPSIRKSVRIPVPEYPNYNFNYRDGNYNFGDYGDDDVIGFGVSPVTFDPIILKIKRIDYQSKTNDISLPWRVRVFTLSTGTWSILSTGLPRESIRLRGSQIVIDRFIYWAAFDMLLDAEDGRSRSPFLIMSFDLIAKEFKEINLTGSLTGRFCSIQTISNLRESLVLLEYHNEFEEEGEPVCSLWMMKKQSVNISFTKLYNMNIPYATVKALFGGFRKTGELILVTKDHEEERGIAYLKLYDPNSEAISYTYSRYPGDDYSFFLCSYMETLLLLNQLDGFIYSVSI